MQEKDIAKELSSEQKKQRQAALKLLKEIEEDNVNFGKQFIETLKRCSDDELVQEIIDFIESDLDDQSNQTIFDNVKQLSPGFQKVWFIYSLDQEICNGGFAQYYFNYSYEYLCEAYNSMVNIGVTSYALIVKKVLGLITENKKFIDDLKSKNSLDFFSNSRILALFADCDQEYLAKANENSNLLITYIRGNYNEFIR